MKKTLVALIAMAGIAGAAPLTLTSPAGGGLESGNAALTWSEDIAELQSWELTFTLTDTTLADAALFGTRQKEYEAGMVLGVTADGALSIYNYKVGTNYSYSKTTGNGWVSAGQGTSITLSYVADVNTSGTVVGGTFTIASGANTQSFVMDDDSLISYTSLKKDGGSRFYTAAGEQKFSNISVSQLSNRVVPEPATATLSLLALCGLAARRRK